MLAAERRDLLVARLGADGKLVAKDLAAELGLSEDSIRRDHRKNLKAFNIGRKLALEPQVPTGTGPVN